MNPKKTSSGRLDSSSHGVDSTGVRKNASGADMHSSIKQHTPADKTRAETKRGRDT